MSESLFATAALKINDSPGCGEVTISGDLIVIRDYVGVDTEISTR